MVPFSIFYTLKPFISWFRCCYQTKHENYEIFSAEFFPRCSSMIERIVKNMENSKHEL